MPADWPYGTNALDIFSFALAKNKLLTVWNYGYENFTYLIFREFRQFPQFRLPELESATNCSEAQPVTYFANLTYTKGLGLNNAFKANVGTLLFITQIFMTMKKDSLSEIFLLYWDAF